MKEICMVSLRYQTHVWQLYMEFSETDTGSPYVYPQLEVRNCIFYAG